MGNLTPPMTTVKSGTVALHSVTYNPRSLSVYAGGSNAAAYAAAASLGIKLRVVPESRMVMLLEVLSFSDPGKMYSSMWTM